jgi:hypothetical protein
MSEPQMTHDEHDGREIKRRWADVMAELRFLEEHDPAFGETFRQLSWVLQEAQVVRFPEAAEDADEERDRILLAPANARRAI